ncbi:UDP-2,4-diacetamido-2,4,6-trideoxy-beta-L-altropyranose hydrolase, partial [Pseudoalteromonas sp. GABNS16G]
MKIAFRADASVQIGTGHVMRCLTLAEELRRQGHQCLFVCRDHKGNLADLIGQKGFELHLLHTPDLTENLADEGSELPHADWLGVPLQLDADQTKEVLSDHNLDWLVVDHYALDARWERQFIEPVSQVMVIDDLADRDHECEVLLDQNLGRQPKDYDDRVPLGCKKLIGPQYALLRPEFSEHRSASLERRRSPELKRILISLGGIDQKNVTGQVLEALSKSILPQDTLLDVVMGRAALHLESVKKLASNIPFDTKVNVGVSDMAMRMYRADLAIGAAGGTA